MSPETARLDQAWLIDIAAHAPDAGEARWRAELDRLRRGWDEPHRAYHTLQHLAEMFAATADLIAAGEITESQAQVVRIAGWYHDLVYDPRAEPGSNEHRSATLARDHLHHLGVEEATVDQVEDLILMTADHQGERDHRAPAPAIAAFHDADLWILAAPLERFDEYCRQVREEYHHVPGEDYTRGRSLILSRLVSSETIYATAHARAAWDSVARRQVARELSRLDYDRSAG